MLIYQRGDVTVSDVKMYSQWNKSNRISIDRKEKVPNIILFKLSPIPYYYIILLYIIYLEMVVTTQIWGRNVEGKWWVVIKLTDK